MKKIFDRVFWLYVALGLANYVICSVVMLICKNVIGMGENICLIVSFALQTSISFVLNRFVTFRGIRISPRWPLKFIGSIAVCYVGAKLLLKNVFAWLAAHTFFAAVVQWLYDLIKPSLVYEDFRLNLVMLACTFAYCVINYVGQRYFVFRPQKEVEAPSPTPCK